MAYRRRQGITRATTFKEEINHDDNNVDNPSFKSYSFCSSNSSLAAQAIRASALHRDSSGDSAFEQSSSKGFTAYEDASKYESKGFWGVLAQKAKAILEDDNVSQQFATSTESSGATQFQHPNPQNEGVRKMDNPTLRRGLDKLTSSLNHIGDTFEKAFEEGKTIVENKTADIIQETRKLQIRRKGADPNAQNQVSGVNSSWQQYGMQSTHQNQTNHETQLKASRDVAMATAAKAKLLLRELKTVKADLAFAKERCAQLEEENKRLRESREKGSNPADDDLIRLQLETLLAEKARLAHENSIYARENRFLREIVEYHQLTMQDVVYIDEGIEEVTEVNPAISRTLSVTPPSPLSPTSSSEITPLPGLLITEELYPLYDSPLEEHDVSGADVLPTPQPEENNANKPALSSA
ncbi:uncharacterized protein LOC110824357 [Carica papaya]|uniref:uncharacterized protein LOC110824357 n=1 Tax=Carica papaya TaxID=3649 RepID=UPI000B8C7867|nr:uncharacterized protein LOC110824357 [Carica papaya]